MNKIMVTSLNKINTFYEKEIKKIAKRVLQFFKKENCYLEIFLINSRKMRILNKKFKNKNKTTGILTFIEPKNFPHPESKLKHLGEIYLKFPISNSQLLITLLVHGLLHLLGYNHQKKSNRIKIEEMEQKLLHQILNPKP